MSVPRRASFSQGGPVCPEAGLFVPRRNVGWQNTEVPSSYIPLPRPMHLASERHKLRSPDTHIS
jgi:hypothetical protein